jgi:DNA helicase-2/ATP-dependent DNA helicase PcrA
VTDLDKVDGRADRVSLLTAHSAKGLEFPVVSIVGMEEGVFPHSVASRDERSVEEERRLCYVGMTRAMERLTLCWALERRRYGSRTFGVPSRFLSEIPAELVDGTVPRAPARGDRVLDYSESQADHEIQPGSGLRRGARVRHAIFGDGTVVETQGGGASQKIRVRFERAGVKTLVLRFANLELL